MKRRVFLQGALVGATCLVLPPCLLDKKFRSGHDFTEAHRWLRDGGFKLRDPDEHGPTLYDTIIVGGGLAGLTAAYELRDTNTLVLEYQRALGGVAKSENWKGIEYCIGSAYMAKPEPGTRQYEMFDQLGLLREYHEVRASNRMTLTAGAASVAGEFPPRAVHFFEMVLVGRYPSLPVEDQELLAALDGISLRQLLLDQALQLRLFGATAGPWTSEALEAVEFYCWGAFNAGAAELSAYSGLNFLASEFGPIVAFPGGNAWVARRLAKYARAKTEYLVVRVLPAARGYKVLAMHKGRLVEFAASSVILATPLFLLPYLVPGTKIPTVRYRSYLVANFLLDRPLPALHDIYALNAVKRYPPLSGRIAEDSVNHTFSDVEVADWGAPSPHSVLTVYCPMPFGGSQTSAERKDPAEFEAVVRRAVAKVLAPIGFDPRQVHDVRLTRWGHAMLLSRPRLLHELPQQELAPGMWHAHTDSLGAPSAENAFTAAYAAVDGVRYRLHSARMYATAYNAVEGVAPPWW